MDEKSSPSIEQVQQENIQLREANARLKDEIAEFESILDAVPYPIHVTDNDMRWKYMNKSFEKLLIENRVISDRATAYGKPCSTANANICNTKDCGILQLQTSGKNETYFDWLGAACKQTTSEVNDAKGKTIGYVETVQDLTNIVKPQKYMELEIAGLSKSYEQRAAGNLTIRYELAKPDEYTKSVHDQLEKMNKSVGILIYSLRKNIREVNTQMNSLSTTADSASTSIGDASRGVQQIAQNTSKVNENAEKASQGIQQITKAMQDMSTAVEEITSSMESVSLLSKETNDLSQNGAKLAGNAEKSMTEISMSSAHVYEIVSGVEKQMEEISKIVLIIRDLANQTNLLALNAAIEAARAGDAGRGFAVVATEVKSLAQESRSSAEKIEDMIVSLKQNTQKASAAMNESKGLVEQGGKMVTESLQSFNQIAVAVEKVAKSAAEVAAATEEQAATTEEVTASVHEVASLVDQTAREASDAAAATEESASALDEISRMVESVKTESDKVLAANRKFRVD
jgi:methyl-accepting chemotaxis protein